MSNSVIPTDARPFDLEWWNEVEEPAVRRRQRTCVLRCYVEFFSVLTVLMIWICTPAATQEVTAADSPQKQLAEITNSLMNGSVTSIDIFHVPDRMETRASVNPENLEKWSQCRITINRVSEWTGRDELLTTMKSTRVLPSSRMPDLRSVVIFYGDDGKRIGALYFGRFFGRYLGQLGSADGAVGNSPAGFKGNLSNWLKSMIPEPLQ